VTESAKTALDRTREKSAAAQTAAEQARAGVTELDQRLENNANVTKRQKQALRNAEAEVTRLKRALKSAEKERARLTKQRKGAVSRVEKAAAKVKAAEAKYEKSVLAEMVQREKERDRQAAGTGRTLESVPRTDAASSTPDRTARSRTGRRGVAAEPPPEQPDAGTATAKRTAARKTAAAAGTRTAARNTTAATGTRTTRTSRTR
jgi:chromosome segregation ATPase